MKLKSLFAALIFASFLLSSCDDKDKILTSTPESIAEYVAVNYPDAKILIVKYDWDDKEYEVKLSNGWELTFNRDYNLVDADL